MKLWALAGLFTVAAVPFAGAADASAECQVDDTRRSPVVRIDAGGTGGSAPLQSAQPTVARETPEQVAQREAAAAARAAAERRRGVMRVPDAELIAPRRTL